MNLTLFLLAEQEGLLHMLGGCLTLTVKQGEMVGEMAGDGQCFLQHILLYL